jgi:hypothetical protein
MGVRPILPQVIDAIRQEAGIGDTVFGGEDS